MPDEIVPTIVLCGVATFLLRLAPVWLARRGNPDTPPLPPPLQRLFQAIGPAAITALLVVSLWPMALEPGPDASRWGLLAALVVMVAFKRWQGGIAAPTLLGAATYGICVHLGG